MSCRVTLSFAVGILALVLVVPGCRLKTNSDEGPKSNPITEVQNQGGGPGVGGVLPSVGRTVELSDMNTLALAYYQYTSEMGKPPEKLADLTDIKPGSKLHKHITDKDVIVFWNVDGLKLGDEASKTVLAYPKEMAAKAASIPCAFYNGKADNLKKVDFEKAPKGGK